VWAHLAIAGNICASRDPESEFQTGVIYFARSQQSGQPVHYMFEHPSQALTEAPEICGQLGRSRLVLRHGAEVGKERHFAGETTTAWAAVCLLE
jgi:hypothetical protein